MYHSNRAIQLFAGITFGVNMETGMLSYEELCLSVKDRRKSFVLAYTSVGTGFFFTSLLWLVTAGLDTSFILAVILSLWNIVLVFINKPYARYVKYQLALKRLQECTK